MRFSTSPKDLIESSDFLTENDKVQLLEFIQGIRVLPKLKADVAKKILSGLTNREIAAALMGNEQNLRSQIFQLLHPERARLIRSEIRILTERESELSNDIIDSQSLVREKVWQGAHHDV